jgi:hypothetical protein
MEIGKNILIRRIIGNFQEIVLGASFLFGPDLMGTKACKDYE